MITTLGHFLLVIGAVVALGYLVALLFMGWVIFVDWVGKVWERIRRKP